MVKCGERSGWVEQVSFFFSFFFLIKNEGGREGGEEGEEDRLKSAGRIKVVLP